MQIEPLDPPPSQPTMIGSVTAFSGAGHAIMFYGDLGFELVDRTETAVRMVRTGAYLFEAYAERATGDRWRGYIAQMPADHTPVNPTAEEPDHGQDPEEADE